MATFPIYTADHKRPGRADLSRIDTLLDCLRDVGALAGAISIHIWRYQAEVRRGGEFVAPFGTTARNEFIQTLSALNENFILRIGETIQAIREIEEIQLLRKGKEPQWYKIIAYAEPFIVGLESHAIEISKAISTNDVSGTRAICEMIRRNEIPRIIGYIMPIVGKKRSSNPHHIEKLNLDELPEAYEEITL